MKPLALVGPTASGKTGLALQLSQRFPIEVISMDSMALYKNVPIVTAQPSSEQLSQCPHHLIAFLELHEEFDVSQWLQEAQKFIDEISDRGNLPLIVGGTFLYLQALIHGIHPMPPADSKLRQAHRDLFEAQGPEALWQRLYEVDAPSANRLHANDFKRVSRALEVYELVGMPVSQLTSSSLPQRELRIVSLDNPREVLYHRAQQRIDKMFEQGLMDEIRPLQDQPLSLNLKSAVGVQEVLDHLQGKIDQQTMHQTMHKRTCHLIKHQLTWIKRFETQVFQADHVDLVDQVSQEIEKFKDS